MKFKALVIALTAVVVVGGSYGLYLFGMQRGMDMQASTTATAPGKLPQSIAEGEAATRRHIQSGIKAANAKFHPI